MAHCHAGTQPPEKFGLLSAPRASMPGAVVVHELVNVGLATACVGPGIWLPGM